VRSTPLVTALAGMLVRALSGLSPRRAASGWPRTGLSMIVCVAWLATGIAILHADRSSAAPAEQGRLEGAAAQAASERRGWMPRWPALG
jgi:hypothetical protein